MDIHPTLDTVRTITPILHEHRFWADEHARMAPAVLEAARDAGVFLLFAPREYGGRETPLPETLAIMEELGYGDPTVAWHAGNSAALCIASAKLPDADARRVLTGAPGPFGFCGALKGRAVPVEGGYRLSGQWPFMTGAPDAAWALLIGVVTHDDAPEGTPPDVRQFIIPASDFTLGTNWADASAMRGTGSNAISVEGAFVPEALAVRQSDKPCFERPAFRQPSAIMATPAVAAIVVGAARRAIGEVTASITGKVSSVDGTDYRERSFLQQAIAEQHGAVAGLHAAMLAMAERLWAEVVVGPISNEGRADMHATSFGVLDQARRLLSELLPLATSSLYSGRNVVEMALRDAHAMAAPIATLRGVQIDAGRVYLGLPPRAAAF